jgi:hypothetical protein
MKFLIIETIRDGVCTCLHGRDCKAPGKHPVTRIHPHGVDDASAYSEIEPFVTEFGYNLGMVMGFTHPRNGETVVAIDADPRNGSEDTLLTLQLELDDLPVTRTASTGGGGSHYLVSLPAGLRLPGSLGAGLDVKQASGYILTAPSRHISGGVYTWRNRAAVESLPTSWIERFCAQAEAEFTGTPIGAAGETFVAAAFQHAGWLGRPIDANRIAVKCPQRHLHTGGQGGDGHGSDTVIMSATVRSQLGAFRCMHSNACSDLTTQRILTEFLPPDAVRFAYAMYPGVYPLLHSMFARSAA